MHVIFGAPQRSRHHVICSHFILQCTEICAIPSYQAASNSNSLPTFWDNLSFPSSVVQNPWSPKIGPIGCTETSVRSYHYQLRNSPEQRRSLLESWSWISLVKAEALTGVNPSKGSCDRRVYIVVKWGRRIKSTIYVDYMMYWWSHYCVSFYYVGISCLRDYFQTAPCGFSFIIINWKVLQLFILSCSEAS
jgi:hypothetical protein